MTDITIPPEALEAAAKEIAMQCRCAMACDWRNHMEDARAACIAMLRAWPGVRDTSTEGGEPHWQHHIILPLTQEKTNAEG